MERINSNRRGAVGVKLEILLYLIVRRSPRTRRYHKCKWRVDQGGRRRDERTNIWILSMQLKGVFQDQIFPLSFYQRHCITLLSQNIQLLFRDRPNKIQTETHFCTWPITVVASLFVGKGSLVQVQFLKTGSSIQIPIPHSGWWSSLGRKTRWTPHLFTVFVDFSWNPFHIHFCNNLHLWIRMRFPSSSSCNSPIVDSSSLCLHHNISSYKKTSPIDDTCAIQCTNLGSVPWEPAFSTHNFSFLISLTTSYA